MSADISRAGGRFHARRVFHKSHKGFISLKKEHCRSNALFSGAGYGSRTRLCGLGSDRSTDELTLHRDDYNTSEGKKQERFFSNCAACEKTCGKARLALAAFDGNGYNSGIGARHGILDEIFSSRIRDCQKSTKPVIARVLAPVAISQNCSEISISFGEFETFYMRFPRRATPSSE